VKLARGTRLGSYEILSFIGAGGMGEVYRARDTRLLRDVALKTLPAQSTNDSSIQRRFEQEACSASALNHPNIVTIHDIGRAEAVSYIAMEVVDGRTLRDMLADGPLAIDKLIDLAAQVADGLAAAHDKRIVHRDLKPENIMVTGAGIAKILDFGLAKTETPLVAVDAATVPGGLTQHGAVLGTVGYMSPEQASGQQIDFRSDQFAFAAMLYEMATARPPFGRRTVAETMTAVIREEPAPVATLNPAVPAALAKIIRRALAKQPAERYGSTRDLARDLADLRDQVGEPPDRIFAFRPLPLPPARTKLVGRTAEVAAAQQLLLRDNVRLVTFTGPGGTGKSALAQQLAESASRFFPAGVFFIPLASITDPGIVASTVAQAMGVREIPGRSLEASLKEAVRQGAQTPMLLVLDNFEQVVAAASLVSDLLSVAPALKVLTTSRAALQIYGEHEFPVPPLAFPDPQHLPAITAVRDYPAIALFQERAQAVKPDFAITDANAAAVAEICARLDGLPLAIELAVARIKLLPPEAILARLQSRLRLLTGGSRDVAVRQQTLRGTIDWSYELLSPAEQKIFRRLSVFVGGCTLEAAEAVCGALEDLEVDILDGLGTLVNQSLLERVTTSGDEVRFRMLETIREYALERLATSPEASSIRRAHAAYYVLLGEDGESRLGGPEEATWLRCFDIEHDNFRTALESAKEIGRVDWGLRLAVALWRYWERREHLAEGRRRLMDLLARPAAQTRNELRARALFGAGVLADARGEYDAAITLHQESVGILRELGDDRSLAVSVNALAVATQKHGDLAAARTLFEEGLGLWRKRGDRMAVSRALSNLANIVKAQEDYAQASKLYEESLAESVAMGDRSGAAVTLGNLGDLAREQQDFQAARSFHEQSLAGFRELGDPWGIATALTDLGSLARDEGDFERSHALHEEGLQLFAGLGHRRGIARLLEELARSASAQGRPRRALRLGGAAAALRETIGTPLAEPAHSKLERALEPARSRLGATESLAAWNAGRAMTIDEIVEYARERDSG
jgi:predicted ATPase